MIGTGQIYTDPEIRRRRRVARRVQRHSLGNTASGHREPNRKSPWEAR